MTAEGPPAGARCPQSPAEPRDHYPYTFTDVSPTAWTQVCDRCGYRLRISAPTVPLAARNRRRPRLPEPLPDSAYFTIGFQT